MGKEPISIWIGITSKEPLMIASKMMASSREASPKRSEIIIQYPKVILQGLKFPGITVEEETNSNPLMKQNLRAWYHKPLGGRPVHTVLDEEILRPVDEQKQKYTNKHFGVVQQWLSLLSSCSVHIQLSFTTQIRHQRKKRWRRGPTRERTYGWPIQSARRRNLSMRREYCLHAKMKTLMAKLWISRVGLALGASASSKPKPECFDPTCSRLFHRHQTLGTCQILIEGYHWELLFRHIHLWHTLQEIWLQILLTLSHSIMCSMTVLC